MTILFMLPSWEDAFRGWMRHMLQTVEADLGAIVVDDSKSTRTWQNNIPVYSLQPSEREIRFFSRLFGRCGLTLEKSTPRPEKIIKAVIRQTQTTHIYCQYGTFAERFLAAWEELDVPLFVHFHGYDATFNLRFSDRPELHRFSSCYLENIKGLSRRAVFIANSEFTKSLLVKAGVSPEKVIVKYLGVPIPREKRNHYTNKSIQILHLGRLVDFKSPDRTIKAFEIAKSNGLDGCLTIAGDGPLRSMCELLRLHSPYRDYIRLLGDVSSEDAQRLISEADIFTQHNVVGEITQQSECLGVSILEAMATGLPVVATSSGGVTETVIDGKTGILVEPGDVDSQADGLIRLAQDPELRQQMGDAGRSRVTTFFSLEKEAEKLREIMRIPLRAHG